MEFLSEITLTFLAAVPAAVVALLGNYWLQQRVNRRRQAADYLKQRLYELHELALDYWISDSSQTISRKGQEAKILAIQLVITSECSQIKNLSKKLSAWFQNTEDARLNMMEAVTGGNFQSATWEEEPGRVRDVGNAVQDLASSLFRAS